MTGGRAIRWSTVAAVAAVAIVAGWVSYLHAYDVVAAHGEHGVLARLYPGTIDGLIYAASMVLLDAARRGVTPPPLARWLLTAGDRRHAVRQRARRGGVRRARRRGGGLAGAGRWSARTSC